MNIQLSDRRFEIIRPIYEDNLSSMCIAKDSANDKYYEITCIQNKDIQERLHTLCSDLSQNSKFRDLKYHAAKDDNYYLVFCHYEGKPLEQALEDHRYTIQEKLMIVKHLYQHILELDMPLPLIYEVLGKENLLVTDSMEIRFHYQLTHISQYGEVTLRLVNQKLVQLLRQIFRKEIRSKIVQELNDFIEDIEYGIYEYLSYEYQAYEKICETLYTKAELGELRSRNIFWKSKELCSEHKVRWMKRVVGICIVVVAGYLLLAPVPKKVHGVTFDFIGTIEIPKEDE